ncbi:MAG: acetyl-CoA C-acetyltransferase [Vicinamibacteria bacterium]|jgi:acetyl-CoA C-acetyltransferase|nr:acetyl-CoA C-acetyltransferase [Vicinamibacteria bacterium]
MRSSVIVSAVRTPTGKFLGGLKSFTAPQLGAMVVKEAIRRAGIDPNDVDEVIMGNVVGAGLGQAPARQAAIHAGLPPKVGALTINKVCGSGLKAVMLAAQGIATGDVDIVVAGGMESMSNCPHLLKGAREGLRMGHGTLVDSMIHDGLWDAYSDFHMGCTGEIVAEKFKVTREQQDEFSVQSHKKALAAIASGAFKDEILKIEIAQKKGPALVVENDESPRADTSMESLGRLKPAFKEGGTVTAGNAPGVNDGASAVVVMAEDLAKARGIKPLARIVGQATGGVEPSLVMMAPVEAVKKLLAKTGWKIEDVDLFELNEAFAVQALGVAGELGLDLNKVNVNGGAVALGHAIGSSGSRILTTLIYALKARGLKKGIATLCLGGGNGVALAIETV